MLKKCKTCHAEKHESEFYKNSSMKDRLCSSCKKCIIQKSLQFKSTHRPYVRQLEKERQKRLKQTPEGRAKWNARSRAAFKRNSLKWSARSKVRYAIRVGRLIRGPCEICGTTEKIHAHHTDYSKPLQVQWLCEFHHASLHGRID